MTNLELNDVQTKHLIRELGESTRNDRYFLSPDRGAKGDPRDAPTEPDRPAPLPPLRNYEPPSKGRYRRRR